ncbi:hypothetical protein FHT36_002915 [Xanthobacter sp. SG618]|nr:hypothetical protein [Xanthobacter sp. SG618]
MRGPEHEAQPLHGRDGVFGPDLLSRLRRSAAKRTIGA